MDLSSALSLSTVFGVGLTTAALVLPANSVSAADSNEQTGSGIGQRMAEESFHPKPASGLDVQATVGLTAIAILVEPAPTSDSTPGLRPSLEASPSTEVADLANLDVDTYLEPGWESEETAPAPGGDLRDQFRPAPNDIDQFLRRQTTIAPVAQIPGVWQLSDVSPGDWGYEALRSLVENYGLIEGYPDGTFRGDRPLTRYEFAAALLQTLDAVTANGTLQERILAERLRQEFAPEIESLADSITALETEVAQLRAQQVSPVLRFGGQVIAGFSAGAGPGRLSAQPGDPTFEYPLRLEYLTQLQFGGSLTGRDVLRIGLNISNFTPFTVGRNPLLGFIPGPTRPITQPPFRTPMSLLSYQAQGDGGVNLDLIDYRFPAFNDRVVFIFRPVGFSLDTVLSPNTLYNSAGQGAISRFASLNPVFRIGALDWGFGADWLVTDRLRLQIAYGENDFTCPTADPQDLSCEVSIVGFPIRGETFGIQLLARPTRNLTTGFAYVYSTSSIANALTGTGSFLADNPAGTSALAADIYGLSGTLQWSVTPRIILGAWGGWIIMDDFRNSGQNPIPVPPAPPIILNSQQGFEGTTTTSTYLLSLGILDPFGREGDLLAFLVGQPPRYRSRSGNAPFAPEAGRSWHLEAFYRFQVNDYLSITPGFFVVTQPNHTPGAESVFVGVVRTTFRF